MSLRWRVLRLALTAAILGGACWLLTRPHFIAQQVRENEIRMFAAMNALAIAQEQFKQATIRDGDGDGTGEYGFLQQLSERGFCGPEFAASARENGGDAVLLGYRLRVFLPRADGSPRPEASPPPSFQAEDANNQETNWVCYAWPDELGVTGNRSCVINQEAQIYFSYVPDWDGASHGPKGDEGFSVPNDMTGPILLGSRSAGGQTWTTV